MTFDYGRLFVISLLVPFVFSVARGDNKYKYAESDERIHRLEDYVSNEILTYLRLLRLENEQRLKLLSQPDMNGGQQYSSDYGDLEWSQGRYDQDWLQESYDSVSNPGQMALWQNSPFANRRFLNPGIGRLSRIPPFQTVNSGKMRNTVPPFPPFSNNMPGSFQASYPFESGDDNGYMQFYKVPSKMSNDQLGNPALFGPDSYNMKYGQLPGGRKQRGIFQPDLQNEGGNQFTSTVSQPLEGSLASPSVISTSTPGNVASTTIGSVNGSPKRSNMKMSSVPSSGQTSINIDSADSESTFETGVRSLTPKRKTQEDASSGVRVTSSAAGGEIKPGNRKYKVLLVNGDEGEEVNFDDVHKKLFSSKGFDSMGGVNVVAASASSSTGGHPQHSFQTVSVSNNGKGATITSSPTSKSTNTISLQSGDESIMSPMVETQPRGVGTKYKNSGFGSLTNGFQNLRLN